MKAQKRLQYLSDRDIIRLEVACESKRDKLLLQIIYETGCTVNELVSIASDDIDTVHNTISFPAENTRTKAPKVSRISDELCTSISEYLKENSKGKYLFSSRQSPQITTKRVRQLVQAMGKRAGLGKVLPQMLRYAHVLHAVEKNIPLDAVEKQTGIDKIRLVQICEAIAKPKIEDPYKTFFDKTQ